MNNFNLKINIINFRKNIVKMLLSKEDIRHRYSYFYNHKL